MGRFPVRHVSDRLPGMPKTRPRTAAQPRKRFPLRISRSRQYYPYQTKYHEWANEQKDPFNDSLHIACLMEMRLGKTLPNIRLVIEWSEKELDLTTEPCCSIVVAPLSVLATWERELSLEGETCIVVHGKSYDKRLDMVVQAFNTPGRTWVLINYESLRVTPDLVNLPWFASILDESTLIKNPLSKISKICANGFKATTHRILLTGLIAPEGPLDLAQQFIYLYGNIMGYDNYYKFRAEMFDVFDNGWQPKRRKPCGLCNPLGQLVGSALDANCRRCQGKGYTPFYADTLIKDYVHEKSFILTRQEAGIGSKKIREVRYIKLNEYQREVYDRAEYDYITTIGEGEFEAELETDHVISQRIWLARIAGGCDAQGTFKWSPKVTELVSLLKGEISNQPVVVGFRFDSEIYAVATALHKAGIPFMTLTGADSREERKRKQEWFRTSQAKSRVILVQIKKVAQYGVDMSISSTMVFFSITYSTEEMTQFEDRIVHPDKKEPLLYLYIIAEDTIDQDAYETMGTKTRDAKMFMKVLKTKFTERRTKKFETTPQKRRRKNKVAV